MGSSSNPNNAPPPETAASASAAANETQATEVALFQKGMDNGSAQPRNKFPEPAPTPAGTPSAASQQNESEVKRFCNPRTMAVNLPEPLGPKLFILGEPVLHRYYTVYNWQAQQ